MFIGATALSTPDDPPRLLVADDTPASLHFLADALSRLGAVVVACDESARALLLAQREYFDLLVLDCRMPGGGARDILRRLRAEPSAASHTSIAIATSAELDATTRQLLLDDGFLGTLDKPCRLDDLRPWVAMARTIRSGAAPLDDQAALSSTGDAAIMRALRHFLLTELLELSATLDALVRDRSALEERLHRLQAACGFCGTPALASQVTRLRLLDRNADATHALEPFRVALRETITALQAQHSEVPHLRDSAAASTCQARKSPPR